MVGGRRAHATDVSARSSGLRRFRLGQFSRGDLYREVWCRKKPDATRNRVERAEVEVRTFFIRLASVEQGGFSLPLLAIHRTGHDAVGDVRRIEPVMHDR